MSVPVGVTATPDAPNVPSHLGLGGRNRGRLGGPSGTRTGRGWFGAVSGLGLPTGGGACEVDPADRVACEVYGKRRAPSDFGSSGAPAGAPGGAGAGLGRGFGGVGVGPGSLV
ncbi:hypothetical protein GCM10010193_54930 [Kitasatospora atroaurantiaca]